MRSILARSVRLALAALCMFAILSAGLPVAGHAVTAQSSADVYVSVDGSDLTGDGTLANPVRTIEMGIALVSVPGTIHVLPGTYHDGESFPLVIPAGVMLESTDGRLLTTIQGDTAHTAVSIPHPVPHTGIEGFTISDGESALGAGILMAADAADTPSAGWPQVLDCELRYNDSTNTGGGMAVNGTVGKTISPRIMRTRFFSNSAMHDGAGIACGGYTNALFSQCDFLWNQAGDEGGSVYVWNSNSQFFACDIAYGAALRGGNVWVGGTSSPDFIGCDIREGNGADGGGGMYIVTSSGQIEVHETRITGNVTASGGAGVRAFNPDLYSFTNCLFEGNQADGMGGAMYIFSDEDGVLEFINCTVVDNESYGLGGADGVQVIDPDGVHSVAVTIKNSVFWQRERTPGDPNSVADYLGFDESDDIKSYSLFRQTDVVGTGVLNVDPLFINAADSDYHLRLGSPAIDTGTSLGAPTLALDFEPRPMNGNATGGAEHDMGCYERPPATAGRLAGVTRYETACEVARRATFITDTAVVASGANFPDALSAAGLAGAVEGPLLLVKPVSVPPAVFDTLDHFAISKVIVVGGDDVVAPAVVEAFEAEGYEVSRVAGATRYETSAEVAREIARRTTRYLEEAVVARGDQFPDALAVGPLAYARKAPVLLVKPTSLPDAIAQVIDDLGIEDVIVAGGEAAVSDAVYDDVAAGTSVAAIERVWGADRYGTAAALASEGIARGWNSANYVGVATGLNFPDALAGGPAAGNRGGVLLLCKTASLPAAPTTFLTAHKDEVLRADIYGGADVVTPAVQQAIEDALDW